MYVTARTIFNCLIDYKQSNHRMKSVWFDLLGDPHDIDTVHLNTALKDELKQVLR